MRINADEPKRSKPAVCATTEIHIGQLPRGGIRLPIP
jgi:hypothetical protein